MLLSQHRPGKKFSPVQVISIQQYHPKTMVGSVDRGSEVQPSTTTAGQINLLKTEQRKDHSSCQNPERSARSSLGK